MAKDKRTILLAGIAVGLLAVGLVKYGNPLNMGFCIACFIRDIAGALGLHQAAVVQYLRPEIFGLIIGSFLAAVFARELKPTGGSSPALRFFLGVFMMVGALAFLGCPLRMILRLAGGDGNALIGLPGYILGIWIGAALLKKGYTLGRSQTLSSANSYVGMLVGVALLLLAVVIPSFIIYSTEGPGSMRAPLLIALAAGLLVGLLAQRSRLCTMGAIRDIILFKDFQLFIGWGAIFAAALAGNLVFGLFKPGFIDQPVAHTDALWNFLGLLVVGLGSVLAGGCPLRQLVLMGEGNSDAALTVFGMAAGAAFMHNFGLAASPAGVPVNGKVAVILALMLLVVIGMANVKAIDGPASQKLARLPGNDTGQL